MNISIAILALMLSSTINVCRADEAPPAEQKAAVRSEPLIEGDDAPDFTLPTGTGEQVTLSSFKGSKNVVLYFYPKDNTPGCTKEAEGFRDDYERFKKAGAEVLGVSVDDQPSHKFFANKFKLNFPLLADVGGKVSRLYGVMGWIMAKRVTFVIGTDGKVKRVFKDVDVTNHTKEVLKTLQAFSPPDADLPAAGEKTKNPRAKRKKTSSAVKGQSESPST